MAQATRTNPPRPKPQTRDWRIDVLKGLGAPVTQQNLGFLASWQRWEGGHTNNDAKWNWLNTTMDTPGVTGVINSVGVKAYDTYDNGVKATVSTLMNGRYKGLTDALRAGKPGGSGAVAGLSTWLSGSPNSEQGIAYAQRVMGSPVQLSPQQIAAMGQNLQTEAVHTAKVGALEKQYDALSRLLSEITPTQPYIAALKRLGPLSARVAGQAEQFQAPVLPDQTEPPQFGKQVQGPEGPGPAAPSKPGALATAFGQFKIIGEPYAGTHTVGNWESDNARDFAMPEGTPIYAVANGTIGSQFGALASNNPRMAGLRLHLKGKNNEWYYAHLSDFAPGIAPGAKVKRGQLLGYSGSANGVAHLHFGAQNGSPRYG